MVQLKFEKVLCTGGSGLLGGHVVSNLLGCCDLTVLDIKPPTQEVPYIYADIADFEAMKKAFAGADAVVHLADVPNPRELPTAGTFNINRARERLSFNPISDWRKIIERRNGRMVP